MTSSLLFQYVIRGNRLLLSQKSKLTSFCVPSSTEIFKRLKSEKSPNDSDLSTSTILLQDGCVVQELPIIVRKVKDVMAPCDTKIECTSDYSKTATSGETDIHRMIRKEFSNCLSLEDVFSLLSKCSTVTPNIAVGAIERIYELEDIQQINANSLNSGERVNLSSKSDIINQLFVVVLKSDDVYSLIGALRVISPRSDSLRDSLCDELLERVTDNKLSIQQICDLIVFFKKHSHIPKFSDNIDKLWVGFTGREKEFDAENLLSCFNILPHLKASQRMIFSVIEKRIFNLWWQLKPDEVLDIMSVMSNNKLHSLKIFSTLGRWLNTNIHVVSEEVLLELISKFTQMNYTDREIEKSLERYMKAKGVKIESHALIVAIINHCFLFRVRNVHILNGCAEYFIANGSDLSPIFIKPILLPMGWLSFYPTNGQKFWQTVESVFNSKFAKINVEDVLDIMLSCVYLQKYPLNFIEKVYNPHFLERINAAPNSHFLRRKLKLLDTVMTLECKAYNGPLLPKDHSSKSIWQDGRIKRLINHIKESLELVAGGPDCLSTFVTLPYLYTTELYVIDLMMHPQGLRNSILNLNLKIDRNINVAGIIHLPEHFCANGEFLIGPQVMRIKQLRLLGFKVVSFKYETLSRLQMHPNELQKYLVGALKQSEPAL